MEAAPAMLRRLQRHSQNLEKRKWAMLFGFIDGPYKITSKQTSREIRTVGNFKLLENNSPKRSGYYMYLLSALMLYILVQRQCIYFLISALRITASYYPRTNPSEKMCVWNIIWVHCFYRRFKCNQTRLSCFFFFQKTIFSGLGL
jgi:hypothetical protein